MTLQATYVLHGPVADSTSAFVALLAIGFIVVVTVLAVSRLQE